MSPEDGDYDHNYDIVVKETKKGKEISLYYSSNVVWDDSVRSSHLLTLIDSGNSIKIKRVGKTIDYVEAFALRLLLNFNVTTSTNKLDKLPCKIIKKGKKEIVI